MSFIVPLFGAALIALSAQESPAIRDLERSLGEVEWISKGDSLTLEVKSGLTFAGSSADLSPASASKLRELARILTKQPQASVLLLGGTAASPGRESGFDEKIARNRAATARNFLIMELRSRCESTGHIGGCTQLDRRVRSETEDPPVRSTSGIAERSSADRVRILLQF